jgi:hypothetical protein
MGGTYTCYDKQKTKRKNSRKIKHMGWKIKIIFHSLSKNFTKKRYIIMRQEHSHHPLQKTPRDLKEVEESRCLQGRGHECCLLEHQGTVLPRPPPPRQLKFEG